VWVFTAGAGAGFVDGAVIVGAEEGAGGDVQHVVPFVVEVEVVLNELSGFDAEVFRQAVDIDVAEDGAGRLAAVGAIEAVDFPKNVVVEIVEAFVQVFDHAGGLRDTRIYSSS
jgi:hypothetical protein